MQEVRGEGKFGGVPETSTFSEQLRSRYRRCVMGHCRREDSHRQPRKENMKRKHMVGLARVWLAGKN